MTKTISSDAVRGHLFRVLGVGFGLAVIIGNTIGSGIFRTPGQIAAHLPNVWLFLSVWVIGGMYALLGAVQIASAAEVIAIAEKIGLNLGMVADALATGQAASPQVIRNARRMTDGRSDQTVVFTPQLRLKDVEYALELARKLEIGSPFGVLAARIYRQLNDLGYASSNESEVIEVARKQLPDKRPS